MISLSTPQNSTLPHLDAKRFAGFYGLRAIAVILVFLQHKISDRWDLGTLGVNIFFVLSGFLIVGILQRQRLLIEKGSTRRAEWLKFWKRRAIRIFPIYYLALAVVGAAIALDLTSIAGFTSYWFFVSNFFLYFQALETGAIEWSSASQVVHFWTLAIEQQFYLLGSVLLLYASAARHATLLLLLMMISLASFTYQAISDAGSNFNGLLPAQNLIFLASGGLLRLRGAPTRHLGWMAATAVLVGIVALHPLRHIAWIAGYVQPFFGLVGSWCLVAHVVQRQSGAVVRCLEWRPFVYLGTISYGFYVYHQLPPGLDWFASVFHLDPGLKLSRYIWAGCSFALALGLASVSWHFLERPLLSRKSTQAAPPQR